MNEYSGKILKILVKYNKVFSSIMAELNEIVATNLIELRKRKHLTQVELAEQIGYSDKSISKWELGKSIPSVDILKQFADFYGVTVDFLITENAAKKKISVDKSMQHLGHKITFILLGVCVVWLIVIAIFVANMSVDGSWVVFVWGAPATALLVSMFSYFYWKRRLPFWISSSAFAWAIITAFFVTYIPQGDYLWYLYLIGIPVQAGIILLALLK